MSYLTPDIVSLANSSREPKALVQLRTAPERSLSQGRARCRPPPPPAADRQSAEHNITVSKQPWKETWRA